MLTFKKIENAQPKTKQYKLFDRDGLYLVVTPAGSKLWRGKYRVDGKEKTLSIGRFPDVTIAKARTLWSDARKLADPSAVKREQKAQERVAREASDKPTFEAVAREWHARNLSDWTPKHAAQVWRTLEIDILPTLGDRPIDEIKPRDVMALIEGIEDRGAGETAARVLQRVRAVFSRAVALHLCEFNPAAELRSQLKKRDKGHFAAMQADELPEFLARVTAYDGDQSTILGLRLLIYTLARTVEIREARWAEFDLTNAVWEIPAERMKARKPHRVPLPRQAVAVLEQMAEISGDVDLVFPGRDRKKPMSENTMLYALYRLGYHSRATVHGFRSLASTILNEATVKRRGHLVRMWSEDAVERALAHTESNKVRGAYDRGDRFEERANMIQWWADYLDKLQG